MTEELDLNALEAEHLKGDGNWCWADQHEYPCDAVRLIKRLRAAEEYKQSSPRARWEAYKGMRIRAEAAEARVAGLEADIERCRQINWGGLHYHREAGRD